MNTKTNSKGVVRPKVANGSAKRSSDNGQAINAAAVKRIRAGNYQGALDLLRKVVYPHGGLFWNEEAPTCAKVNFAVALYLDNRWGACRELLLRFDDEGIETRETRAIRVWLDQLTRWEKLKLQLGAGVPLVDLGPDVGVLN